MSKQPKSAIEQLLSPEKEPKKRQFSFYIDSDIYKEFMSICKKNNLSGSKVINAAMQDFISKYGKR